MNPGAMQFTRTVKGDVAGPVPVGFIIDSPWLPNWSGITILDYFTSDEKWFLANMKAVAEFPEILFLPGFWSEFGMCTEPSAFGAKCVFPRNEFPFAEKVIRDVAAIDDLAEPNPQQRYSLHYEGRSIDLITLPPDHSRNGRLCALALHAGFDWVHNEIDHCHASIRTN